MNKIYKGVIDITIECNEQELIIDINKGSTYNMKEYSKPQFLKMFETLESLGDVEELTGSINNFKFEKLFVNECLPCKICTNDSVENCRNCKFFKNLLNEDNDANIIKSTEVINNKIINLIKSF